MWAGPFQTGLGSVQRPWEEPGHQRPPGGLREGTSTLGLGYWWQEWAGLMAGGAAKKESGQFRHQVL